MVFYTERKVLGALMRRRVGCSRCNHGTRKFEPPPQGLHRRIDCCGTLAQQCANFDQTRTQTQEKLSQRPDKLVATQFRFCLRGDGGTVIDHEQELRRHYKNLTGGRCQSNISTSRESYVYFIPFFILFVAINQDGGCESCSYSSNHEVVQLLQLSVARVFSFPTIRCTHRRANTVSFLIQIGLSETARNYTMMQNPEL